MRDVEKYISNLSLLGLETVIKISPGESTDGYVFFPKGPIFGFGIDEYGVAAPTFLVNIDNDDVSADGLLVNAAHEFSSGDIDEQALMERARQQGVSIRREREKELLQMQGRLAVYQLDRLISDVQEALREGDKPKAQHLIASYVAQHGSKDPTGSLAALRASADLPPVASPEELVVGGATRSAGRAVLSNVDDATGAAPSLTLAPLSSEDRAKEPGLAEEFGGPVYVGTYGVLLTEPPKAGGTARLRLRALGNDTLQNVALLQFAVSKGLTRAPKHEQFTGKDHLEFTASAAEAEGAPRLASWFNGYTVHVRVQLEEEDRSKIDATLLATIQKGLHLLHEDLSDPTVGPRDLRRLSIVFDGQPPK